MVIWCGMSSMRSDQHPIRCIGANNAGGKNVIRVLLIGCGDVALRTARLLHSKVRLYGLTRRVDEIAKLRAHGIVPVIGALDRRSTLGRLRAAPSAVLHFAPPPS